jgi:hypothetical protein
MAEKGKKGGEIKEKERVTSYDDLGDLDATFVPGSRYAHRLILTSHF